MMKDDEKKNVGISEKLAWGESQFAKGHTQAAETCFCEILETDPNNKVAFNNLGVIAYSRGRIDDAIQFFTKSLREDPFYEDSVLNLCDVLRSIHQLHEAVPYIENVVANCPENDNFQRLLKEASSPLPSQPSTKEQLDPADVNSGRPKGQTVLILVPDGWLIEECCVQRDPEIAPGAALVLAAYLRKCGHTPVVRTYRYNGTRESVPVADALVVYCPWQGFSVLTAPVFRSFKRSFPDLISILIMYESLADFEVDAMKACPEIDYAVLPNEKEMAVRDILTHGSPRCEGGFGNKTGIVYRDADGIPRSDGKRPFAKDLSHLPYAGAEITRFLRRYAHKQYRKVAIVFGRGCPGSCTFCPMRCTRSRFRDPEAVLRECLVAKEILGRSSMWPMTLEMFRNSKPIAAFSDLILAQNADFDWDVGARCEFIDDVEFMKQLNRAGLRSLYLGVECATERGRAQLNKSIAQHSIEQAIKITAAVDINTTFAFIVGFPWEDASYMRRMNDYFHEIGATPNCKRINLARLIPYPGLPIESELISEGILERTINFQDCSHGEGDIFVQARRTQFLDAAELDHWYRFLLTVLGQMQLAKGRRM